MRAANAALEQQTRPAIIMQSQRIAVIESDPAIFNSGCEAYTAVDPYGKEPPAI
jgi:hypothetical protein